MYAAPFFVAFSKIYGLVKRNRLRFNFVKFYFDHFKLQIFSDEV